MSIVGTRPPLISETNLYEPHHKASYDLFSNRKIISFPYKKAKGSLPEGCPDQE